MPLISADKLTRAVESILVAAGADTDNARRVAHALVLSDLSGVATHGVQHVPGYVRAIQEGEVLPAAKPSVLSETDTSALVSGNWTFGFVAAKFGLDLAIDKARSHGMSTVGVVQANHIGRLGEYAEVAAENDMVSITWASGYGKLRPVAVPYGGSKPLLSTNPISIGAPAGDGPPMILDYATTSIAQSKAMIAVREGRELDPGLIVDLEGRPETSPQALFDGEALLLPFGGHKGSALMLACEVLGRLLSGSDAYAEPVRGGDGMKYQGVTFMLFRADLFQSIADFTSSMTAFQQEVRDIPPADGFDEVVVPGDLEARARADRRANGLPLPDDVWEPLVEVAASLDVELE